MKDLCRFVSGCAVAIGVVAAPAAAWAAPLVLVPDDQPTITAAHAAVDPGGIIRITDSGVYEESVAFTKAGVTLEAVYGTSPKILYPIGGPSYLIFANQPVKIGSSTGGRITLDGGGRVGMTIMLNASHATGTVTFENLRVEGMTASVNVIYPQPATTGDTLVKDTIIDANFVCELPVRLDFVNPGETLTFQNVAVLGATNRGIFTGSLGGGTFNLIDSYIESLNTAMDITSGAGDYTINITGSYLYSPSSGSSGGALYARSTPTLTAVNSVFRSGGANSYGVYLFTDGASTPNGNFTFENCDIIGDGTTFGAMRMVSSAISDTLIIRDCNIMHLTADNRSFVSGPSVADIVTLDYNSLSGARGGFPPTLNVEYNIIPDYVSINDGNFAYTNGTLIVGDTQGDPVGSFKFFRGVGDVLLVELESFTAHSAGVGHPVEVRWSTSSEIDNVGFHLYRLRFEDGLNVGSGRVNSTIIPGAGTTSEGSQYKYVDSVPLALGEDRAYVLVDLDANGTVTRHGPVRVQVAPSDAAGEQEWMRY